MEEEEAAGEAGARGKRWLPPVARWGDWRAELAVRRSEKASSGVTAGGMPSDIGAGCCGGVSRSR